MTKRSCLTKVQVMSFAGRRQRFFFFTRSLFAAQELEPKVLTPPTCVRNGAIVARAQESESCHRKETEALGPVLRAIKRPKVIYLVFAMRAFGTPVL